MDPTCCSNHCAGHLSDAAALLSNQPSHTMPVATHMTPSPSKRRVYTPNMVGQQSFLQSPDRANAHLPADLFPSERNMLQSPMANMFLSRAPVLPATSLQPPPIASEPISFQDSDNALVSPASPSLSQLLGLSCGQDQWVYPDTAHQTQTFVHKPTGCESLAVTDSTALMR